MPSFIEASAPSDDELHALLQSVIARLMKLLTRRGVLIEEMGQTYMAEPDDDGEGARTPRPLQAAAVTYRIAFGPRRHHTPGDEPAGVHAAAGRVGDRRAPLGHLCRGRGCA